MPKQAANGADMATTTQKTTNPTQSGPFGDFDMSPSTGTDFQGGLMSGSNYNSVYAPKYLNPSGTIQTSPVNVAGMTPESALAQGRNLLRNSGPGSSLTIGPGGEVSTTLKGADPFSTRLAELSKYGIFNQQQGGGAGTSEPPRETGGSDIGGDEAAARAAAFARGKDQAALIAQKGLEGVKNLMAARGIGGSTIEGGGIMDVFSGATNTLGNLSRDITMADAARAGQIADRNYAGNIEQRGQDIDYRLGLEDAANRRSQSLISLLNAAGAAY